MLLWIAFSVGLQVLLYVLLSRKKEYVRALLLLLFLLLNLTVLPAWYAETLPEAHSNNRCGMYEIGVYFGFWVAGGGSTLITYTCFFLYHRSRRRKGAGARV